MNCVIGNLLFENEYKQRKKPEIENNNMKTN